MSAEEIEEKRREGALRVERAIVELRRGRVVEVSGDRGTSWVTAVDRLDPVQLRGFTGPDGLVRLILTAHRARAVGLSEIEGAVELRLPATADLEALAGVEPASRGWRPSPVSVVKANRRAAAGCRLAGVGRLVPAVLLTEQSAQLPGADHLRVSISDVEDFAEMDASELLRVSRARVPLIAHDDAEVVLYRERFADAEHLAVVIGRPDRKKPVMVRLHSACLTGDLLGSLRCDCGDQLRGAASRIAAAGGGVLLYLAQEGRGIGLSNKLRAYALQDTGLDTLEADLHLGFTPDERDYRVACHMLKDLGIERVRLLTNNPAKILALEGCGIRVVGRASLPVRVNPHNARYLRTKREGAGHLDGEAEGSKRD